MWPSKNFKSIKQLIGKIYGFQLMIVVLSVFKSLRIFIVTWSKLSSVYFRLCICLKMHLCVCLNNLLLVLNNIQVYDYVASLG